MDDVRATLESLDGQRWGDAPPDATSVIRDAHRLRTVPLAELTTDNVRFLLTQRIGVDWLIPLALERLSDDPLVGDLFPGDLLNAVLIAASEHWDAHPEDLMSLWAVRESLERIATVSLALLDRSDWPRFG